LGPKLRALVTPEFRLWTRSGPKGRVLHMSALAHITVRFQHRVTDVTPAIIEPVIATSAGTPR